MAEYLPLHTPGKAFTRQASAAITGGQLVGVSGSGTVAPTSAATPSFVGVASNDALSGDNVAIYAGGVQRLVASGAITAGATVEAAAAGKVSAHTNGANDINIVGVALTTAADGALVEVQFER
jgi:predicted RecA/RadA family phage recombinase